MQHFESDFDETPVFNVMQVVALNAVSAVAILAALKTGGSSWGVSLLGAWVGGSVSTVAILAGAYWLSTFSVNRKDGAQATATTAVWQQRESDKVLADLVPTDITDPLQMWEEDRLLELDNTVAQLSKTVEKGKPEDTSKAALEQMWHDDAVAEAEEARMASRQPVRYDRRQASIAYTGPERRAAGR